MKARHVFAFLAAPLLAGSYLYFIAWAVGMGCGFAVGGQNCHLRLRHFFDPETTWTTLGVALISTLLVVYALRGLRKGRLNEGD